jgi:hypothetical protein
MGPWDYRAGHFIDWWKRVDLCRENNFDFPLNYSTGRSMSLVGDTLRFCSTSLWQHHVQSMEAVLGLVQSRRTDSFLVEVVCCFQETPDDDILQDYTSQETAVCILIWDPGIGMLGSPEFGGIDIRVEWLLEELTEDIWHMIILIIKSI